MTRSMLWILVFLFASTKAWSSQDVLVVNLDGTVTLPSNDTLRASSPSEILVFSATADGQFVPGIQYHGMSSTGVHSQQIPGELVEQKDGSFILNNFTWRVFHGPRNMPWSVTIPGSKSVPVLYLQSKSDPEKNDRQSQITFIYNHDSNESGLVEFQVLIALHNAKNVLEELFADDSVAYTFEVSWLPLQDPSVIGFASQVTTLQNYSTVRTNIVNRYESSSEDTNIYENRLYANLPLGSSIPIATNANPASTTASIEITQPLRIKLNGSGASYNYHITLNSLNPNFVETSTKAQATLNLDLTGLILHEVGHHLGFSSCIDDCPTGSSHPITVWDIFRLNASVGSVSGNEFFSERREMRESQMANAVMDLNSSLPIAIAPLSQGKCSDPSSFQASHFANRLTTDPDYIGLMDPQLNFGSASVGGRYFQTADVRAFDVMGYAIAAARHEVYIEIPVPQTPSEGSQVNPALPLDFEWDPKPGSLHSTILVYDLGSTVSTSRFESDPPLLVYEANEIPGNSLQVSVEDLTLQPGHLYQWFLGVYNKSGVHVVPAVNFTARCFADWNNDGLINFFDLAAYMGAFNAMDPAADLAAPFGVWNFFDISAFQALQNAGCP